MSDDCCWDCSLECGTLVISDMRLRGTVAHVLGTAENAGELKAASVYNQLVDRLEELHDPAAFVQHQLAAERFAIWLVLAPILDELAELNRDNDDGHVTGFEITLFQRRMQAALEAIGQGLHRFEGEPK